jgi:hypothetical protein
VGDHVPSGISGACQHAQEVDGHDPMKIGQVVIEERAERGARNSGIVHHDVQTAEFFDSTSDQRANLFGVGDICRLEKDVGAQRGGQRLTAVGFDAADDDPRALGHKPFHRGMTNTGRAAGDDGYFAG